MSAAMTGAVYRELDSFFEKFDCKIDRSFRASKADTHVFAEDDSINTQQTLPGYCTTSLNVVFFCSRLKLDGIL